MAKAVERGLHWVGLPVIDTLARSLCHGALGPEHRLRTRAQRAFKQILGVPDTCRLSHHYATNERRLGAPRLWPEVLIRRVYVGVSPVG